MVRPVCFALPRRSPPVYYSPDCFTVRVFMEITNLISTLLTEMQRISSSETVVGKPIRVGDATIIPISKLGMGFGAGTGGGEGKPHSTADGSISAAGAGGGISVDPQAFIVVDKNGQAQLLSINHSKDSVLTRAIELIPTVVDKLIDAGASAGNRLTEGATQIASAAVVETKAEKHGRKS